MRTFQGTFHANPDYALWYGWSEMVTDLAEIKEHAEQMIKQISRFIILYLRDTIYCVPFLLLNSDDF